MSLGSFYTDPLGKLNGFSPFAPREQDLPKPKTLPLDCARCGRWLVQSPAFHKTRDGYVCWPLCEDA